MLRILPHAPSILNVDEMRVALLAFLVDSIFEKLNGESDPRESTLPRLIQHTQTTMANINLNEIFCADPIHGASYRSLLNGGSWFEADQAYWKVQQQKTMSNLGQLIEAKATKTNVARAESWLLELKESAAQIVPMDDGRTLFEQTEKIVKTWEAPPNKKTVTKTNVFALLDNDDEE